MNLYQILSNYLLLKSIIAFISSISIVLVFGNLFIFCIKKLQFRQIIRDDGPIFHLKKTGTPTMGGVLIVFAIIISTVFTNKINYITCLLIFTLVSTGAIGLWDDYLKIFHKTSKGLSGRYKFLLQSIVACIAIYFIFQIHSFTNIIHLPMMKIYELNTLCLCLLMYLAIVGSSNGVNLTDGLDGLVSIPIIAVTVGIWILGFISNTYIENSVLIFAGSIAGAVLGFLFFNTHPARIFMGDVGSLSLGAVLGLMAILIKQEFAYIIMAGVFIAESLSVIIQVVSYKSRKKRVFLMAPLHHHFELKGMSEKHVVLMFWLVSVLLMIAGVLLFSMVFQPNKLL